MQTDDASHRMARSVERSQDLVGILFCRRICNAQIIVPAKAGTQTLQRLGSIIELQYSLKSLTPGVMGPRFRGDDTVGVDTFCDEPHFE